MIRSSFVFLDGIGSVKERRIWESGVTDWDLFLNKHKIEGVSSHRKAYYDRKIHQAKKALYSMDSTYFMNALPQSETWRLYDFFRSEAIFLDIETTGLSRNFDDVTVIGLYDGISTKTMIQGINFDHSALRKELEKYKLIVTFNGASFDLPFIKKRYPNLIPNVPNFDVKCISGKLGLSGGLKSIERELGIKRTEPIGGFYGGDALTLWRMYRGSGDDYYLNLLVEYNEYDIVNLKKVAEFCVDELKKKLLLN